MEGMVETEVHCPDCLCKITDTFIPEMIDFGREDVYQPVELDIFNSISGSDIHSCPVCKSDLKSVQVSGRFAFSMYKIFKGEMYDS